MNSVTVPFIVSGLFSSYSAFPWCAKMGTAMAIKPAATAKNGRRLLIAATPCRQDLGENGTIHPAMPSNNAGAKMSALLRQDVRASAFTRFGKAEILRVCLHSAVLRDRSCDS